MTNSVVASDAAEHKENPVVTHMRSTPPTRAAEKRKRIRLTPEQRIDQIIESATRLVAQHGYFGVSLQDVANDVGITQAGLLHYIHNKEGLLELLVRQRYDTEGTPADYIATGAPEAVHPDGISFPGYCRFLVKFNSERSQLMKLYMVLGTEAASPIHPAYKYFVNRPDLVWEHYSEYSWRLPEAARHDFRPVIERALEVMDGIQIRYFRLPSIDINTEWARFEPLLFPSPTWDGYR